MAARLRRVHPAAAGDGAIIAGAPENEILTMKPAMTIVDGETINRAAAD